MSEQDFKYVVSCLPKSLASPVNNKNEVDKRTVNGDLLWGSVRDTSFEAGRMSVVDQWLLRHLVFS